MPRVIGANHLRQGVPASWQRHDLKGSAEEPEEALEALFQLATRKPPPRPSQRPFTAALTSPSDSERDLVPEQPLPIESQSIYVRIAAIVAPSTLPPLNTTPTRPATGSAASSSAATGSAPDGSTTSLVR
jgi:hypothetical protein